MEKIKTLLGTATPSMESYYNAHQGKYGRGELKAMKIRRHYISTKPLDDYYQIISDIKADESIPT